MTPNEALEFLTEQKQKLSLPGIERNKALRAIQLIGGAWCKPPVQQPPPPPPPSQEE